ncbi:MAG: TonB-dependent receptor [Bacteroidaceae bacterium]|nr:TonB-dependent receptor [Bacteroidaceae bacterium]
MKKYILFILITVFSIKLNAQILKGKVIDNEDKKPLVGVNVYAPDLNRTVSTDAEGIFIFTNISHEKTRLVFSRSGYEKSIQILDSKKETELLISLKPAFIQIEEIVVTGGTSSSQHENAIKIDAIKKSDLSLVGTPNLMESITSVPGVDMISKGSGISKPVIRGLSMNDILVLNDGVRIENYQFSENHPLGVDDVNLDKVEIVKGPASMLYGSDAIGGVLNFVKESPAPVDKIEGEYGLQLHSNTLGINNSFKVKGASKHFFGGIAFSKKNNADYKQGGGDIAKNSRFNELSLNANIGYTAKIGSFKLNYDYFGQKLGMCVPAVQSLITERGRKNKIWYQDLDHYLISSKNILLLGSFRWENNIALQSAFRKLKTVLEDPTVQMRLNTLTYESKLYFPSTKNSEYTLALQGMNQTNRNQHHRISEFLPNADVNSLGALLLAQHNFFSRLKVQGGLRYDGYSTKTKSMGDKDASSYRAPLKKDFHSFNGSAGFTYNLSEQLFIRSNFAKAYRVPNLSELTSNGLHGSRYEIGNSNLNPEKAYEADLSLHYHIKNFSFDLAGFYNHVNDYIFISPTNEQTNDGVSIYQFSQTDARLYGGETAFEYRSVYLPCLSVKGNYSIVIGKEKGGDYLPFIPAQKVRLKIFAGKEKLGFIKKPSVWFGISKTFKQTHPSLYETETDGYTLCDAGIDLKIKSFYRDINLSFIASNLFDVKYYDHLSTLKSIGIYNSGRNISFALSIPFGN